VGQERMERKRRNEISRRGGRKEKGGWRKGKGRIGSRRKTGKKMEIDVTYLWYLAEN
jgi:hypothetical protein